MKDRTKRCMRIVVWIGAALLFLVPCNSLAAEDSADCPAQVYVALGDSVAAHHGLSEAEGYVPLFSEMLAAEGYQNAPFNLAKGGLTTGGLLKRLSGMKEEDPAGWETLRKADLVTLHIGGNNVQSIVKGIINKRLSERGIGKVTKLTTKQLVELSKELSEMTLTTEEKEQLRTGVDVFKKEFPQVISAVKTAAPGAKIMVCTIYDPLPGTIGIKQDGNAYIREMNQVIWAGDYGYTVVDVYSAFASSAVPVTNFSMFSGSLDVHPNAQGQALLAKCHIEAFRRELLNLKYYDVFAFTGRNWDGKGLSV